MRKVLFSSIKWDTDGASLKSCGLPKQVILDVEDIDDLDNDAADILSDKYGWCVKAVDFFILPDIGSKWKWKHLQGCGRVVEAIFEKSYGTFILYTEIFEGKEVDLKVTSLEAWVKAEAGRRPYLSALLPRR